MRSSCSAAFSSLGFFNRGMTTVVLQFSGTWPLRRERLTTSVIGGTNTPRQDFNSHAGTGSNRQEALEDSRRILLTCSMKSTGKLSKDMDMPMISPLVCLLERTLAQRLQKLRALKTGLRLNFSKTWEILLYRRTSELAPPPVPGIQRKECLKLSGITFHEDPCIWDLHIDSFLSRAASRRYNYS